VTPQRHATLSGGNASVRIAEDDAISSRSRPTPPLKDAAPADQPTAPAAQMEGIQGQRDGREGEHHEAEVVDATRTRNMSPRPAERTTNSPRSPPGSPSAQSTADSLPFPGASGLMPDAPRKDRMQRKKKDEDYPTR